MLDVKFILNDKYLASYVLTNYEKNRFIDYARNDFQDDIVAFQNLAWDISSILYKFIDGRNNLVESTILFPQHDFDSIVKDLDAYFMELLDSREFKVLKSQTEKALIECQDEWNYNFEKSLSYIQGIGISTDSEYRVWFVHPGLKAGKYLGEKNICWTNQTYWSNYNTVYIWHEILHSFFGSTENEHALIELVTDNGLRVYLNGGTYPPFEGHSYLEDARHKVLPFWLDYIRQGDRNIDALIDKIKLLV